MASAPRHAASLLLLRDDPFEVLMVRRRASGTFAGALVFPGGAVDDGDADDAWLDHLDGAEQLAPTDRAARIAALRETWEETGILITTAGVSIASDFHGLFRDAVVATGGRLAVSQVVPFSHWITPEDQPRRFDTRFFVAAAPAGQEGLPDGGETVALEWVSPAVAIARAGAGDRSILFPTLMNLTRLAKSGTCSEALAAAVLRPQFPVRPVRTVRADGIPILTIPDEAGYPVTEWEFQEPGAGSRLG